MKPGWKTSEHWMTWATHLLLGFLGARASLRGHDAIAAAIAAGNVLNQWSYTRSRERVKSAASASSTLDLSSLTAAFAARTFRRC